MSAPLSMYEDIKLTLENDGRLYQYFLDHPKEDAVMKRQRCSVSDPRFYLLPLTQCRELSTYLEERWLGILPPTPPIESIPNTNPEYLKKESIMSAPTSKLTFAQKFVVNGNDVSTLTLPQIYTLIAGEEARIKELEKIVNKPKALTTEIAEANATLKALVEHLDSK